MSPARIQMVVKIIKKGNSFGTQKITPTFQRSEETRGIHVVKKAVKKPLTIKQKRVVAMVGKGRTSKAKILREAGYAPSVVDHPERVFGNPDVASAISTTIARMEGVRNKIIKALEGKKMSKVGPLQLAMMMNMHTKDIQLLSGQPTDRTQYELPPDKKLRLQKLLEKNRKKN